MGVKLKTDEMCFKCVLFLNVNILYFIFYVFSFKLYLCLPCYVRHIAG